MLAADGKAGGTGALATTPGPVAGKAGAMGIVAGPAALGKTDGKGGAMGIVPGPGRGGNGEEPPIIVLGG